MTDLHKARWVADGNEIHLGMDFAKVDKAGRTVSGWATVDNVDTEGDIVTAEASADAFARSRGNLREMHRKDSAVGRMVSFKQKDFRAPDGKTYKGIFVKVRISEGAEDTWLKVLDGTLNAFSIGGSVLEHEEVFHKDAKTNVRKVTKYDLTELSLVDNPGNQYSDITNVFKFKKSKDGSVTAVSGMVENTKILNVYYCDTDEITIEDASDSADCPICSEKMTNIGFVEDGATRDEKVNTLVTKYIGGGGETMTKNKKNETVDESVETGHEAGDPTEVPTPAVPEEEADDIEKVNVEEAVDSEEEISKRIDSLKDDISSILNKNNKETAEKIDELQGNLQKMRDEFDGKTQELHEKLNGINQGLETAKSRLATFEKSLDKMNSSGAFKKSADLDESVEQQAKTSFWGGAFS